jgi:hypothetical protein
MVISFTMYRTEFHSNLHENLSIHKQTSTLSNRFTYSIHNCVCKISKTGLILYPKDIENKNVILLVCEQCYNYKTGNDTQHNQLEKWYFNIYQDFESFHYKSRFSQKEDGSFCFYNAILNTDDLFHLMERDMEKWEKETIQQIIQKKLDNVRS